MFIIYIDFNFVYYTNKKYIKIKKLNKKLSIVKHLEKVPQFEIRTKNRMKNHPRKIRP